MNKKRSLLLFLFILFAGMVLSQNDYQSFYKESLKFNNAGMYVLGSWAIINISTGAYGWAKGSGENKYFHQMNLFWNTVNLSIAGIALYNNFNTNIMDLSSEEMMNKHKYIEKLLLINGGLDLIYMGTGSLLRHISKNKTERKNLLKGYGNSLILQGGFLLVFDAVLYFIMKSHRVNFLENIDVSMGLNTVQLSIGL